MKYFNKKFGFTIAEMMVCLALISIIATILIPAIMQSKPNKNKILFKKAYMLTERVVNELVNDENAYKFKVDGVSYAGFEETSAAFSDDTAVGDKKFCILFAAKLNIVEESPNCVANKVAFTTSDGIAWTMPITTFSSPDATYNIIVDVNGDKAPNCRYSTSTYPYGSPTCSDPDQFIIKVKRDGSILVGDDLTREYLKTLDTVKR